MNFTGLSYFVAVAEDGNITKTAEKLHISQQALSSQMTKLEKELGVILFERTPFFSLTYAGERLLLHATNILKLEKEIYKESIDISDGKRSKLSIGISYTCGRAILPVILPDFCRRYPLVEINLMEGNSEELEDWMKHGKIDLMIAFEPIRLLGLEEFNIMEDKLFLLVPIHYYESLQCDGKQIISNEKITNIDIQQFQDIPFIMLKHGNRSRDMLDNYMKHTGYEPNVILETENSETALALAQKGMGATVFSGLFLKLIHPELQNNLNSKIVLIPLDSQEVKSRLVIARRVDQYHSRIAEAFLWNCIKIIEKIS